jgi:hypothetical protein
MRCQGIIFVQDNRRRLAPQHMDHVATPIDDPYFTGVWLISPPPFQDGDPARLLVRVARLLLHLAPHSGPSYAALHYPGVDGVIRLPRAPGVVSSAGHAKGCDSSDPQSFQDRKEVKRRNEGAERHRALRPATRPCLAALTAPALSGRTPAQVNLRSRPFSSGSLTSTPEIV